MIKAIRLEIYFWLLISALSLGFFLNNAYAVEAKAEDAFRMQTVIGDVSGKTRSNVSIQYKQDGSNFYDAVIPLDDTLRLKGYRSYSDIKDGDKVLVNFKEFYTKDEDGKEVRTGRIATVIELLRSQTGENRSAATGKLVSKESE